MSQELISFIFFLLPVVAYYHGHKMGHLAGAEQMYEALYDMGTPNGKEVIVKLERVREIEDDS